MKSLLLVLFCVIISFCETAVSDFAPLKIGEKWVYSYYQRRAQSYFSEKIDSLMVEIELSSIETIGNDTLVLLNIKESGVSKERPYPGNDVFNDSIVNKTFFDSVIIVGNRLSKPNGYRSKVCPFFRCHTISIDSLQMGVVENDSLYYFAIDYDFYHQKYVQNVGLYSYDVQTVSMITLESTSINLISYNAKVITLGAKKKFSLNSNPFKHNISKLTLVSRLNPFGEYDSMDGKRLNANKIKRSNGILIRKQF
jgi:hypothetical protein